MENTASRASGQPTGPKAPAHPAPLTLVRVPFQGEHITVTNKAAGAAGDQPIPLRPLCDRLGVDVESQRKKLRGKPWATPVMITAVADDGKAREMVAIPLRAVPLWLATIHPGKVAPSARPMLEAFQAEACDVLYRHFLAPPAPVMVPTIPGTIEAARIEGLEARVRKLEAKARKPAGAQVPRAARVAQLVPLVVELVSKQPGIPGATGAATALRRRRDWVHAATRAALTAGILENRGSENRPRLYIAGLAGRCA